jgi:ABC-type amino acid transport substrate-binding protein
VGVDAAPPPPMNFGLPGSPDFKGFEVDLLEELGRRLGARLDFRAALWSQMLEQLERGELDIICTAVTVTPDRQTRFDFSVPYLHTGFAIVSRRDAPRLVLEAIQHDRVGVRFATSAESFARAHLPAAELEQYHFNTEIYAALTQGYVDAVLDDSPIAGYFASLHDLGIATVPGSDTGYALMLQKESTLRQPVNDVLTALKSDGMYARMYGRWFSDPQWSVAVARGL